MLSEETAKHKAPRALGGPVLQTGTVGFTLSAMRHHGRTAASGRGFVSGKLRVAVWGAVCVLAAGGVPGPAGADEVGGEGYIRYENSRLTVNLGGTLLSEVLVEVGRQSGVLVTLSGFTDRPISDRFRDVPLEDALRRLLANENFTVLYAQDRGVNGRVSGARLKELHVYGSGGATAISRTDPGPASTDGADAGQGGAPGGMMEQFSGFLQRHQAVEIPEGSALAAALNTDRPPFTQLLSAAMKNEDPALRADAAEAIAQVFDGDPESPELVGGSSENVEAIASAIHTSGGANAAEFLRNMGRHLKTPALRLKANQILARVRRLE